MAEFVLMPLLRSVSLAYKSDPNDGTERRVGALMMLNASQTAHISAIYAPFLAVAIAVGTPPVLAALALAVASTRH